MGTILVISWKPSDRPPPPRVVQQDLLMAAEESGEYF
jgi:hypothetical protein